MSGSCDERTGLLSGLSDADGLTQRKLGSPKSVPELPEDNSTPWSKRQSLRLAASLVLLSVFVLTAAKFRLLFNPARLDSMASSPTEQYPQGTPHYWVDKSDKKLEKMNQTSPLFTLANTQVATLRGGISKLFHQFWRTPDIPDRFMAWSESWKRNHPDWHHIIWTAEDNSNLAYLMSPIMKGLYDKMPQDSVKADLARILYMKHLGGCYADLDVESIRPLDELLKDESIVLARMGDVGLAHDVPNAFMCSAAGHPFWDVCLAKIIQTVDQPRVDNLAGPRMLHDVLAEWDDDEYKESGELSILHHEYIFPFSWLDEDGHPECDYTSPDFDSDACKQAYPEAFAITYWAHNWNRLRAV